MREIIIDHTVSGRELFEPPLYLQPVVSHSPFVFIERLLNYVLYFNAVDESFDGLGFVGPPCT